MTHALKQQIVERGRIEGFDVIGFTGAAAPAAQSNDLGAFLERGFHGEMTWMSETRARRVSPDAMWEGARSAIVLGLNYGPSEDPLDRLKQPGIGNISVYAQGHDYHDLIKKKLKRIASWIAQSQDCEVKVFVDTAPLMEKPLAQRAGLGWQGKHTNLVSRDVGSWLFLGTILTDLDLPPEDPQSDTCGTCRACLDICPTNAFPAAHQIDARRCISYLTIEHKGHIAREFRKPMGNRIYGCDDCLAVCPWNKFAEAGREAKLAARDELKAPSLKDLAGLDDAAFRALFRASPVKRIGRDRFVRNVLIAIGNSGEPELAGTARRLLDDASSLVRAMAVWSLAQLLTPGAFADVKSARLPEEMDPHVRAEWEYTV